MECDTLECHSTAVAFSTTSGSHLCTECAIKVFRLSGPGSLETLEDAKWPWEHPADSVCEFCGVAFTRHLISITGGCPKCHKPLPEFRSKGFKWDKVNIKYKEGPHD